MTDQDNPELEEAVRKLPLRSRITRRLAGSLQHKDWAVLGIGIALSGVSAVVGVAHLAWPWLFAVGCAVTAVAALATRALEEHKLNDRVRRLWEALAVASAILLVAFCYHQWWDPSVSAPRSYQVIVDGNETQIFLPYDEPGGSQGYAYPIVPSDEAITLDCYVALPTSGFWYRIQGNGGWIPRDGVHAIRGVPFPNPPHC